MNVRSLIAVIAIFKVICCEQGQYEEIRRRLRSPVGQPYFTIGLGPACYNHPSNKTTTFQLKAQYHDKIVKRFYFKNDYNRGFFRIFKQYQYFHVDVCEGSDSLLNSLVELLLNPKYTITKDPSTKARRKITQWKYQSNILLIFAFLTDEMFVRLAGILSQTDILVMNLRTNILFHQNFYIVPNRFVSVFKETRYFLREIIRALNWRYISLVTLQDRLPAFQTNYRQFYKLFKELGICFNTETILIQPEHNSAAYSMAKRLCSDQNIDVVVVLGSSAKQLAFLHLMEANNKTWLLNENYDPRIWKASGQIFIINDGFIQNKKEMIIVNGQIFNYYNVMPKLLKFLYSLDYLMKVFQTLYTSHRLYQRKLELTNSLRTLKLALLAEIKDAALSLDIDGKRVYERYFYSSYIHLESVLQKYKANTPCPLIECEPGREYIFKRLDVNETQWNESYQWSCQLCPPGFYKKNYGNFSCQQCPVNEISHERRDLCYDPYTLKTISFQQPFSIIAISLAGFGVCCCMVVFIGFIKFRTTPMMKAADVNMTMVHLFIIAFNLVVQPFLFMGKPVLFKCYGRLLSITVCYTLTNAVILWRSQKVLSVFKRRVIMNAKQIKRAKFTHFAGVLMLVVTANLLVVVLVLKEPVQIIEKWDREHFEKTFYCNTWQHSIGLVTFSICLQFVCFVQAFRGRRLPGAFKETMSIVYGSFITIVVFIVVYPIVFFHKDVLGRDSVYWIAVTFNLDILVMFCYFRRVYVAVFLPEMNTIEYSRKAITNRLSKNRKRKTSELITDSQDSCENTQL